jgi:uncharacterized protein YoxC
MGNFGEIKMEHLYKALLDIQGEMRQGFVEIHKSMGETRQEIGALQADMKESIHQRTELFRKVNDLKDKVVDVQASVAQQITTHVEFNKKFVEHMAQEETRDKATDVRLDALEDSHKIVKRLFWAGISLPPAYLAIKEMLRTMFGAGGA